MKFLQEKFWFVFNSRENQLENDFLPSFSLFMIIQAIFWSGGFSSAREKIGRSKRGGLFRWKRARKRTRPTPQLRESEDFWDNNTMKWNLYFYLKSEHFRGKSNNLFCRYFFLWVCNSLFIPLASTGTRGLKMIFLSSCHNNKPENKVLSKPKWEGEGSERSANASIFERAPRTSSHDQNSRRTRWQQKWSDHQRWYFRKEEGDKSRSQSIVKDLLFGYIYQNIKDFLLDCQILFLSTLSIMWNKNTCSEACRNHSDDGSSNVWNHQNDWSI